MSEEERRELADLWKQAFPAGRPWGRGHLLSDYNWNFSNLQDEFKHGGVLHGEKVFLFGCIEPRLLSFGGISNITCVPCVAAIVAPFPPSDKIGVITRYVDSEEIIDMEDICMGWVPYNVPPGYGSERFLPQIFLLSCVETEAAFELNPSVQRWEPYFNNPFDAGEREKCTVVDIEFPTEAGRLIVTNFDWKLDKLEDFADDFIAERELSEDDKDAFMKFVEEKVEQGKRANREAMEKRIQAIEELRAEGKADAVQNIRIYKFYPVATPDTPDVSRVKVFLPSSSILFGDPFYLLKRI